MGPIEIVTLVVLALVAVGWYLSYTAARLDRLHTRIEGTYAALDAQLVRRAEAALELANARVIDPASSLFLAAAATDSLSQAALPLEEGLTRHGHRGQVESDLTEALRLVLTPDVVETLRSPAAGPGGPAHGTASGPGAELVARIADAQQRVCLARRFHNDAVSDALRVRRKPVVQVLRLAGHTEMPLTVDLDDDLDLGIAPA